MKGGIYAIDFDDVLTFFSEIMFHEVKSDWRHFKKYFVDTGCLTNKEIQSRKFFYMNEWLIHPKYTELTSEEYSALQLKIWRDLCKYCFTKDIYRRADPTPFAKRTLMNPLFIESPNVTKVYIISRNVTDEQTKSKEDFIKRYFSHPKIEYISVPQNESKGQVLLEKNINWDVFIDDELPNIRDVAEKFKDLTKKEFIIPEYGYNKMPQDLRFLIEARGGIITYFDPFKTE